MPPKVSPALGEWLLTLEQEYAARVLSVDTETARIWGELTTAAQGRGKTVAVSDGLIAASAIRHGLRVITCDVGDFCETGAMLLNPWGGRIASPIVILADARVFHSSIRMTSPTHFSKDHRR